MRRRDAGVVLLAIALLLGLGFAVRSCWHRAEESQGFSGAADSLDLAQFEAEIAADSVRLAQARQHRYDSLRASWRQRRSGRRGLSDRARDYLADRQHMDSVRAARPEKLPAGAVVDLSTADSATLVLVPLVGKERARQILGYGRRLGGYVSPQQLLEIEDMPPAVVKYFVIYGMPAVERLRINRADFKTLVRHPYLSYEQVKEIMNYRRRFGNLRSWQALSNSALFSQADVERLTPYISFD